MEEAAINQPAIDILDSVLRMEVSFQTDLVRESVDKSQGRCEGRNDSPHFDQSLGIHDFFLDLV